MWRRWSVGMAVCAIYVPAGRSGFRHLLSHLAHRWSKGETCASVTRLCVGLSSRQPSCESEPLLHPPSKSPIYALTQMTNAPSTWREKLVEDHRGG